MEEGFRNVLQANKREMFDGMRAYHESEIKHTNHAITILLSITGAANAASVTLLSKTPPAQNMGTAAFALFGVVAVFAFIIALTTHLKIRQDNASYRRFGAEYYRTSKALQLMDSSSTGDLGIAIKPDLPIGHGIGYRRTQHIIWAFAMLCSFVTWGFSMLLIYAPR